MIIVTSIAPKHILIDQQLKAVNSWLKLGFSVFSLNCRNEINILKDTYTDVNFVQCEETGMTRFRKPLIKINSLINFGKQFERFMIINSDIELDNNPRIIKYIKESNHFIYFRRYDYKDSFSDAVKQAWGIDGFVFTKELALKMMQTDFYLGQCWWDNWIPCHCILIKKFGVTFKEPFLYHKDHEKQWSNTQWSENAKHFLKIMKQTNYDFKGKENVFDKMCKDTVAFTNENTKFI